MKGANVMIKNVEIFKDHFEFELEYKISTGYIGNNIWVIVPEIDLPNIMRDSMYAIAGYYE